MIRNGINLRSIQKYMRHSSLAITERYTHVLDDDVVKDWEKVMG